MADVLAFYDKVKASIAKIDTVQDAKNLRDKAEALRHYAKSVGEGLDAQNRCAEIKIRAEHRAGLLLQDMDKAKGAATPRGNTMLPRYEDIGIPKMQASRWQMVATWSDQQLDEHITEVVSDGDELTTTGVLRAIRQDKRASDYDQNVSIELPAGQYRTIVIDPPWQMAKIDRDVTPTQVRLDYPQMSVEEISDLPIGDLLHDQAHVYLWTTQKNLPSSFDILQAWGLTYVFEMIWHKPGGFQPFGLPQYNAEFVLFGRRRGLDFQTTKDFPCCFQAPRGEHSQKPATFYDLVRRVSPGPRLDMFSRKTHEGFEAWGNEAGLLDQASEKISL